MALYDKTYLKLNCLWLIAISVVEFITVLLLRVPKIIYQSTGLKSKQLPDKSTQIKSYFF